MKLLSVLAITLLIPIVTSTQALAFQTPVIDDTTLALQQQWERHDLPVATGETERTWSLGPQAITSLLNEPWVSAPFGQQGIQYFDKGRLIIEVPFGTVAGQGSTNIVDEMISGIIATGNTTIAQDVSFSNLPVAGDLESNNGPTYATLTLVRNVAPAEENTTLTERIDLMGEINDDETLAVYDMVPGPLIEESNHRVATVFWDFLNSSGTIWDGEEFVDRILYGDPLVVTGLPITEAYWVTVPVLGTEHDVLIQCFERRCMTYTPANPERWRVEFNNAGQHYFDWRYIQSGFGAPTELSPRLLDPPSIDFVDENGAISTMGLEIAETSEATRCGLMHRLTMPGNHGMLFVFDQERQGGFWNRNTFIPLTLAWIASNGIIVDLTDMEAASPGQPQEPITYTPVLPYQYVIEANQGWFVDHDIGIGDLVELGPALLVGQTTDGSVCAALGF